MENSKNYSAWADDPVDANATGWVLYDAECRLCLDTARRFEPLLRRHGLTTAPLQTPGLGERAGVKAGEPLTEMKLLEAGGAVFGGAEAIVRIARRIWWAWPLYAISFVPGAKTVLHRLYRAVANRGDCFNGACHRPARAARKGWIR